MCELATRPRAGAIEAECRDRNHVYIDRSRRFNLTSITTTPTFAKRGGNHLRRKELGGMKDSPPGPIQVVGTRLYNEVHLLHIISSQQSKQHVRFNSFKTQVLISCRIYPSFPAPLGMGIARIIHPPTHVMQRLASQNQNRLQKTVDQYTIVDKNSGRSCPVHRRVLGLVPGPSSHRAPS